MASFWDMIPAAGQGPGVVPRQPNDLPLYGEQNPIINALQKQPSIPNPMDPPDWMRQVIIDAIKPVADAGQWLGGVMGGNVPFSAGDAVTNLGGAALAGIMPPGTKAGTTLERSMIKSMASHELPQHLNRLDAQLEYALKGVDINGPVDPMDLAVNYESLKGGLPQTARTSWEQRMMVNSEIDRRIEAIEKKLHSELKGTDYQPMDLAVNPNLREGMSDKIQKLLQERDLLAGSSDG
jgi:hypothetical protein